MADSERRELPHHISILVVDDDALVRAIIVEYLQSFGFTRIQAPEVISVSVPLLLDAKIRFDLVLCDWHMPEVNGFELLKLCKKVSHRDNTKFIMVTSQIPEERDKITKARAAGVDGYILKPFNGETLRAKIWEVLNWDQKNANAG